MIYIDIQSSKKHHYIKINGHANFNRGNDIVCSAVSVLTYTLMQSAIDEKKSKTLNYKSGNADLVIERSIKMDAIAHAIFNGYEMVANEYKENVYVNAQMYPKD